MLNGYQPFEFYRKGEGLLQYDKDIDVAVGMPVSTSLRSV
jgi:hypothetical protein